MRPPYYRTNQLLATDIDDNRFGEGQSAETTAFCGSIRGLLSLSGDSSLVPKSLAVYRG